MAQELQVKTMAECLASGEVPEILFWVGCAGSFDDRAKKITKAIAKILTHCNISFAILGEEEMCSGDPAKRAGNEFLFQMTAMQNIQILRDKYQALAAQAEKLDPILALKYTESVERMHKLLENQQERDITEIKETGAATRAAAGDVAAM